jgi:hypothetical protein
MFVEQERNSATHPEFRNWFYIYKNFSVEPHYKAILQENYLTEVKDVDRLDKDAVKEEAGSMEASEPAPAAGDALVPEVNIRGVKPEKSDVDESMAPQKLVESVLPEKMKEVMPEKNEEGDQIPDKVEDTISLSETEEIMQVSDEEPAKKNQEGPLKIVLPIPFPEKLKLRKMFDEREASPSGAVLTMQEEMLGSQKETEKGDDKNRDEQIETEKTDDVKGIESMGEKMEIPSDTKIEDKMEEIKDTIKNDNVKESGNMGLVQDEKGGNKMEAMKPDADETMKDDKMETSQGNKMETTKEDGMEAMKDDTMEKITDGKLKETKGDKTEAKTDEKMDEGKDDKTEAMKDENMEVGKEDKTDATKDEKIEAMQDNQMEATKDDKMEAMKDDKMEAMKDDKMEAMKDGKMEATKDDKMEAMKDDKMEVMKDEKMEAVKDDKVEAMKDDKMETMKDDKMEAMKDDKMEEMETDKTETMNEEAVANEKENERTDSMVEGMKIEVIKDDIKKDETAMEDNEKNTEGLMAGAVSLDPVNEKKEAMIAVDRKARRLYLPRLRRRSLQSDDVTSSISSNNIVRKDTKSKCILKLQGNISTSLYLVLKTKNFCMNVHVTAKITDHLLFISRAQSEKKITLSWKVTPCIF